MSDLSRALEIIAEARVIVRHPGPPAITEALAKEMRAEQPQEQPDPLAEMRARIQHGESAAWIEMKWMAGTAWIRKNPFEFEWPAAPLDSLSTDQVREFAYALLALAEVAEQWQAEGEGET